MDSTEGKKLVTVILNDSRTASRVLANADTDKKNEALRAIAAKLRKNIDTIVEKNAIDVAEAEKKGQTTALIDRLTLSPARVEGMAKAIEDVISLEDPVGEIYEPKRRPNGLLVSRMRVPLGVIGLIFEARPNVLCEAASLCLKSGNALVARGGTEALNSNLVLGKLISKAISEAGLPVSSVQVIPKGDRELVLEMLKASGMIDLLIPRGGESLVRFVSENARVPWVGHFEGICHIFIHREADLAKADEIVFNAKVQRPGVCNAMETLLVDEPIALKALPLLGEHLKSAGVELRGCEKTCAILPYAKPASEGDFGHEFLDLKLAVKVVDGIDGAINHIAKYSSNHTESIITENYTAAQRFLRSVNSSCVLVNASTRFNDGGELGLGSELGISTSRMHAFGPMGLREMTISKFIVLGNGQVRK